MQSFRNTSIKYKQVFIVMLTSGVALLLACIAFASYDVATFRSAMVQQLSTLAEIVGSNCSAALDFSDPKAATETLSALRAEPNIKGACIYTSDGELFATYHGTRVGETFVPPRRQPSHILFGANTLELFRPIVANGEIVGTVYVNSDLNALYSRLNKYIFIAIGVFLAAGLIAFLLSARLQQLISGPILNLVQTARAVTVEKNYSVRASKENNDELGVLIDAFNEMLNQIQIRDFDLQKSQAELEERVSERTQEVVNSLSLVSATLESTTDGILVTDARGLVTSFNEKFLGMFRIPKESNLKDESSLRFAAEQLLNAGSFLARIQTPRLELETEEVDLLEFKDGRVLECYSKPQRVGEKCVGRVWSFRDITERRRSEAELEEAHKKLLDASRQAGMAEVATSVLHNVGNVLNSVNVSSTLVSNQMRKSKVDSLCKVVAIFNDHAADLGTFLTTDPKGQLLPGYLGRLAAHLVGERDTALKELYLLHENIEHIKDVVVMQQGYAKISGIIETVNITDLVEEALRLNLGSLQRHNVTVCREFEDVPPMDVEKHKILQILVNLMRNAKYACDESLRLDKLMTLQVARHGEQVSIAVIDNGIGILPENMKRIFNHGFTTRKEGHGFGLHSAVLAAMEMGGTLKARSDGPQQGAAFTLEVPFISHANPQMPALA